MKITVTSETGDFAALDVDPEMELEDLMGLVEIELGIPQAVQVVQHNGKILADRSATLAKLGIGADELLLVMRSNGDTLPGQSSNGSVSSQAETIRQQILNDPRLLGQLRETQPDIAEAAMNNPGRFSELLQQVSSRTQQAENARRQNELLLNSDPFDIEAQKKIEEAIRQENVLKNMEHAFEHNPEAFSTVSMLWLPCEVNGVPVKAMVDSGAQATIMQPEVAERLGIMRLIDTRFAGMARGVGTAKILGRVHAAQLKIGTTLFLECSFTIMEGRGVPILFGLDQLKKHGAVIDLAQNSLVIGGKSVPFLPEHEIPKEGEEAMDEFLDNAPATAKPLDLEAEDSKRNTSRQFPGQGRTLQSDSASSTSAVDSGSSSNQKRSSEPAVSNSADVQTLIDLSGCSATEAQQALRAAAGNVEIAASLLYQ